jgi:hypothetical protein
VYEKDIKGYMFSAGAKGGVRRVYEKVIKGYMFSAGAKRGVRKSRLIIYVFRRSEGRGEEGL